MTDARSTSSMDFSVTGNVNVSRKGLCALLFVVGICDEIKEY